MSVKDQLHKKEPPRPPRALEEGDLFRMWSFIHAPTEEETTCGESIANTCMEHREGTAEFAAWENRIRERGWLPRIASLTTREALFLVCHAEPRDEHLDKRVEALEAVVQHLNTGMDQMVAAMERMQSGRIVRA